MRADVSEPFDGEEEIGHRWTVRVGIPPLFDTFVCVPKLPSWSRC